MPNPEGKNQYTNCPKAHDEDFAALLRMYHHQGVTSAKTVAELLLKEHGIKINERSICNRRKELGLLGSGRTTSQLPDTVKRQLVLDALANDPLSNHGPNLVRENIRARTGINLTRDYVRNEMMLQDPDGFEKRAPTAKKIHRSRLTAAGPDDKWSANGHDKLVNIGFPFWGVRDKWSGKWHGLWVVPNNRLKFAVAYLYLSLVHKLGGMPIQSTTDCGSEMMKIFGLAQALREAFTGLSEDEYGPAHRFLRSIHNITIERGWFRFRVDLGDNLQTVYKSGEGLYNSVDPVHYDLHQWLWPKFVQQELDDFRERMNNHPTRFDKDKALPSGVSPNIAYSLHEQYGGENCLIPVDREVIRHLMNEIGEEVVQFVSPDYAAKAKAVFRTLNTELTKQNIWDIFTLMLPLMS